MIKWKNFISPFGMYRYAFVLLKAVAAESGHGIV
jgi:hypothetical protein